MSKMKEQSAHQSSAWEWIPLENGQIRLVFRGDWTLPGERPVVPEDLRSKLCQPGIRHLSFDTSELGDWDSVWLSQLNQIGDLCRAQDIQLDPAGLPAGAQALLKLAAAVPEHKDAAAGRTPPGWITRLGEASLRGWEETKQWLSFTGESLMAFGNLLRGKALYRRVDFLEAVQQCGVDALPIVALISVMVGMILAFLGAIQLKMFGAQIYVADLVGIGMTREMGALMTGIIMAGRTGASFAARLGSMQVNEEVDALTTLGFSPMEFLVLPRMMAMILMMPLLCVFSNFLGIVGGALIGVSMLDLTLPQYYFQTIQAVSLTTATAGLFKSMVFGVLVAMSGCMYGIRCGRSASAVGEATTKAVVSGIVTIIVFDCLLSVVYTVLGI